MSDNQEAFGKLNNLITSFNTALILDAAISKDDFNNNFKFALKLDRKLGYLYLDLIINRYMPMTSALVDDNNGVVVNLGMMDDGARLKEISVAPKEILYTLDLTNGSNLNIVRSYLIEPTDVLKQAFSIINEYREVYSNSENTQITQRLFYYNNNVISSMRDQAFLAMAKSMIASWPLGFSKLNLGLGSFVVPHLDDDKVVDKVVVEINNLHSDNCSRVGIKYIVKPNRVNDQVILRNGESAIDLVPFNAPVVQLTDDYYRMILNTPMRPGLLTEIYRDIEGTTDD